MTPIDPIESYIDNYFFLIGDKNIGNFTRLLELKVGTAKEMANGSDALTAGNIPGCEKGGSRTSFGIVSKACFTAWGQPYREFQHST